MITGRGPGAPGVTPGMVYTRHHDAHGPRNQTADLSAIRRSDAIADLLARRRLLRPHGLHDPAVALLSALAADVDSVIRAPSPAARPPAERLPGFHLVDDRPAGDRPPGDGVAARTAPHGQRVRPGPGPLPRPGAERPPPAAAWARAAAAVAVAATVAGAATTGVMVTGMLARLARFGAGAGAPGGPGARHAGGPGARTAATLTRRPRR